jgi:glutamine amidotransferase
VIAIIDYGMGNLRSVQRALERAGADVIVTGDPMVIKSADGAVLHGVGAFGEGMTQLELHGLVLPIDQLIAAGKPFLGICLGMQLLFTTSEELGHLDGLGVFKGTVRRFADGPGRKVPHAGWNQLQIRQPNPLLDGVAGGSLAYFVYSYYVEPARPGFTVATTEYGAGFASVVARGNVYGVQFHPEKSQEVGATILKNFVLLTL